MLSIGVVTSIIFVALAVLFAIIAMKSNNSHNLTFEKSNKTTAILLGFRQIDMRGLADEYLRETELAKQITEDNAKDKLPVVKFEVGGKVITQEAEFPSSSLSKSDIGKQIKIRYSDDMEVYIDDATFLQESNATRSRIKRIFYVSAFVCFIAAILSMIVTVFIAKAIQNK